MLIVVPAPAFAFRFNVLPPLAYCAELLAVACAVEIPVDRLPTLAAVLVDREEIELWAPATPVDKLPTLAAMLVDNPATCPAVLVDREEMEL